MAKLYGLSPLACRLGIAIDMINAAIHRDDRERAIAKRLHTSRHGGLFVIEYRTTPSPGNVRWVLVRGRYECDEHGHAMRGRGIVIDITDIKQDGYADGDLLFATGLSQTAPQPFTPDSLVGSRDVSFEGRNQILRLLSSDCWADLKPNMEHLAMPQGEVLYQPDEAIDHVYFPEEGVHSVLARADGGDEIEVGVYGFDGLGPVSAVLGVMQTPQRIIVQIAGHGHRISARSLSGAMDRHPALRKLLAVYMHTAAIQTAFTALSHATQSVEKRLARWLLMCHDRLLDDEVPLTHAFLATMLSVRRPGVTVALHILEGERLIGSSRGRVTIRDRQGLEIFAGDTYGKPEDEYGRLIGRLGRS